MQARHLACLVGHLSQKPTVGSLVRCLSGQLSGVGLMQGHGRSLGHLEL